MSSSASPLLVGLFVAGLLLTLIWVVAATFRRVERFRLHRRSRTDAMTTSETRIDRPRVPDEKLGERSSPTADADVTGVGAQKVEAGLITDNARQVPEPLEEAALEATQISAAAGREHERARHESEPAQAHGVLEERQTTPDSLASLEAAEREPDELLLAAERQNARLVLEAEAEAQRRAAEITADARRRAGEQLEEAEREARAIVVDTAHERALLLTELERERMRLEVERSKLAEQTQVENAVRQAEALLVAAEHQRDEFIRESEAEAERKASDVTAGARRQAQELLEKAEREAARIVADARQERTRLVQELARERSVLEETRTRLSGFLTDVLEEVETATEMSEGPANVRDIDEARAVRTSTGADH